MFVYALTNHKGGVGKTTAAATLGAAFAAAGRRVLLVDLDPQASLTAAVGAQPGGLTVEDVITAPWAAPQAIVPCGAGMKIVPARVTLAIKLLEMAATGPPATALREALHSVHDRFDTAVIDCPSGMGPAITIALTAADVALVPMQCDYLSLRGLADMQAIAAAITQTTNPGLQVRAFASMYCRRTTHGSDVLAEARQALGARMLDTLVPRSVRMAEAPATGTTVLEYASRSRGAEAYQALAQELTTGEMIHGKTGRHTGGDTPAALQYRNRGAGIAGRAGG
jgi:chromosome partitioning protein